MKLTLKNKLVLIGVIPSLATIFFLYTIIMNRIDIKADANKVKELCNYVINASQLLHELQKERGASAIYVASKGTKMKDALESNKTNTDKALDNFNNFMNTFNPIKYNMKFGSYVKDAVKQLHDLSSKRLAAINLSISKSNIIGYYTVINTNFVESFSQFSMMASNPAISTSAYAYTYLMHAKELSGIERAVIGGIVGANKPIRLEDMNKWMTVWKGSEMLLSNFKKLCSNDVKGLYESSLKGPVVINVENMRSMLLKNASKGNFGISGKDSFKILTKRINALKNVENYQSDEIRIIANAIVSKANNGVILYSGIGGFTFIIIFFFTYFIIKTTYKLFGNEPDVIEEIANEISQGNLTIKFDTTNNKGETGIYLAMKNMTSELSRVVGEVKNIARSVSLKSRDLNSHSTIMAEGASEQAASGVVKIQHISSILWK